MPLYRYYVSVHLRSVMFSPLRERPGPPNWIKGVWKESRPSGLQCSLFSVVIINIIIIIITRNIIIIIAQNIVIIFRSGERLKQELFNLCLLLLRVSKFSIEKSPQNIFVKIQ